jgi:dolichol-phosphate mannosyltransferase
VRAVVVLPTYNEAENIDDMLRTLRAVVPSADILVVDDSSPDGTGRIADAVAAELGQIEVLHRVGKNGLGAAYREGFGRAFDAGYDAVVSMDSDFSHDPAVIPEMLRCIEQGADAAIGSRYVAGGGTLHWPLHRRLLSKWGNRYTGWALGVDVRDCTSGFRAYRTSMLAAVDPAGTTAEGYAFLTELVQRLSRASARIVEVPIVFRDRARGQSKMSGAIIVESMLLVTRWGLRDRWTRFTHRRSRG